MAESRQVIEAILKLRDNFTPATRKVTASLKRFGASAKRVFSGVARSVFSLKGLLVGLGAALVVRGLARTVQSVAELGDVLGKMSTRTGISVDLLSRLKFAAEQSGASLEVAGAAVQTLQRNIGIFRATGAGDAGQALKFLSEGFQGLVQQGAPAERLLLELADEMNALGSATEKTFIATSLLGDGGAQLLPFFASGKEGLRGLFEESERLGAVWRDIDARGAEAFGDAMNRLGTSIRSLLTRAIAPLLAPLAKLLDKITMLVVDRRPQILGFFAGLVGALEKMVPVILRVAGQVGGAMREALAPFLDLRQMQLEMELGWAAHRASKGPLADLGGAFAAGLGGMSAEEIAKNTRRLEAELKAAEEAYARFDMLRRGPDGPPAPLADTGFLAEARHALLAAQERARLEVAGGRGGDAPSGQAPGTRDSFDEANKSVKGLSGTLSGLGQGLDDLRDRWTNAFSLAQQAVQSTATVLSDQLSAGIIATINGTERMSDAFRSMARNVLESLQKIIVKMVVMRALGALVGAIWPTADTPTEGTGTLFRTAPDLESFSLSTPGVNARGTPMTRGLSIAGEAGPEAIIPLPGNRRVPVELFGGGGGETVINISTIDAKSFDSYFRDSAGRQASYLGGLNAERFQADRRIRGRYS